MKIFYYIHFLLALIVAVALAADGRINTLPVAAGQRADGCRPEMQSAIESMHQSMISAAQSGDCDENFVRLMLPHHEAAIEMARIELVFGKDAAMRRLAQEIITDQQSEINLMQLWLEKRKTAITEAPGRGAGR